MLLIEIAKCILFHNLTKQMLSVKYSLEALHHVLSSETTSNLRQALCIISYLEASQIDLGTLSPDTRQFVIILANSTIRKREHLSV